MCIFVFQVKQKRTRTNPPRKWNVAEESALIEFLLENSEIEVNLI